MIGIDKLNPFGGNERLAYVGQLPFGDRGEISSQYWGVFVSEVGSGKIGNKAPHAVLDHGMQYDLTMANALHGFVPGDVLFAVWWIQSSGSVTCFSRSRLKVVTVSGAAIHVRDPFYPDEHPVDEADMVEHSVFPAGQTNNITFYKIVYPVLLPIDPLSMVAPTYGPPLRTAVNLIIPRKPLHGGYPYRENQRIEDAQPKAWAVPMPAHDWWH